MFSPVLDMCFVSCNLIRFADITNIYNASTNRGGWGSINGATAEWLDSAIITILDSDGSTVFTYDVTSQVPDPVTGDIIFTDFEYDLTDGEYTISYELTFTTPTETTTYTYSKCIQNTCNFECCIDRLIATIPDELCKDSCNTEYIDEVLLVEGLYYGFLCSTQCDKDQIKEEIEKRLQRFCDFQCDC